MSDDMEVLLRDMHTKLAEKMLKSLAEEEVKPATLTAIAKFLKDNYIIHVPESQDALEKAAEQYEKLKGDLDDEDSQHLEFPHQKQA